ncbi:MAG TPA: M56 and DUF3738 domain-containing protein [Bryobacteraceae bacterium]|nr:M56 and DUF3738 domain-containing protein [Bryobacteraceae bacterium]
MTVAIANHLWQSTVFAAVAALLAAVLRQNHARVRHGIWLAASLKFLVPFSLLVTLGTHLGPRRVSAPQAPPSAITQIAMAYVPIHPAAIAKPAAPDYLPILALIIWCLGAAAVLIVWCVRWRRAAATIRAAQPVSEGREIEALERLGASIPIVSSSAPLEPGVFGIWRPVLYWPAGISEHLSDSQLESILAHEASHVRRRDNLTAAIHMLVEAFFWFHPLLWWIGARLVAEREKACDESVLRSQAQPRAYAEGILKVCEYCLEAPVPCVSGVSGADLKKRIHAIVSDRTARDLGTPRRLLLTLAGIVAVAAPFAIGLLNAPASQAQTDDASLQRFEVATIKPATPGQHGTFITPGGNGGIHISNMSLKELLAFAWRIQQFQLSGGPSWIESTPYDILAKPDHRPKPEEISLMLRSLLADRFQLKTHHETKDLPVYALVLANKDGKLGPQLTESKQGSCEKFDPSKPPQPPDPSKPPTLGCGGMMMGPDRLNAASVNVGMLAGPLARMLGRTILDKTGLTGNFDIQLHWTPDQAQLLSMAPPGGIPPGMPPPQFDPNGPSIFTALQEQLGLKLESQKGPVDILIIDHVERPSEN